MFPHSITIYTLQIDKSYLRQVVEGVYWYGEDQLKLSGKGVDSVGAINIVIPSTKASELTAKKGSYIVKGEVDLVITSIKDLNGLDNVITVDSIGDNDVGSPLDNVVIKGK